MVDRETARAIAQAKIDEMFNAKAHKKRSIREILFWPVGLIIFHPIDYLRCVIEEIRYPDPGVVLIDQATRDEDFGWVFFYDFKRFLITRNEDWAMLGNAPLIIDRCDGSVHITGTARPTNHYIEKYRKERTLSC